MGSYWVGIQAVWRKILTNAIHPTASLSFRIGFSAGKIMSYPYFTVLIWKDPTKRVKSKHKKNHRHLNFLPEKKREKKYKEDSAVRESVRYKKETKVLFIIVFVLLVH